MARKSTRGIKEGIQVLYCPSDAELGMPFYPIDGIINDLFFLEEAYARCYPLTMIVRDLSTRLFYLKNKGGWLQISRSQAYKRIKDIGMTKYTYDLQDMFPLVPLDYYGDTDDEKDLDNSHWENLTDDERLNFEKLKGLMHDRRSQT